MAWRQLSKNIQELSIDRLLEYICVRHPREARVDFIFGNYVELKKTNPLFPFLVRECKDVKAKLVARYDFGVEKSVIVEGKNASGVADELQKLIKHGETMPRSTESFSSA